MLNIFIGYDKNETVAYHVLANSIMRHTSIPVSITPLIIEQLPMTRPRDEKQSTDFSFSRFLVPHLSRFEGHSLFMDCDMLVRGDIAELVSSIDLFKAVTVVKHDYTPSSDSKFLNQKQSVYPRKNWSSVMFFNNAFCHKLSVDYVNTASGLDLHRFNWIDDGLIGELPAKFNHLVGEFEPNPDALIVHYTLGTPCFGKYRQCEFSSEWYDEKQLMLGYNKSGEFGKPERIAE